MHHTITLVLLLIAPQAEEWKAGTAKKVITPAEFMWMSGYAARKKPAEGKLHDLWLKGLAIEDPHGTKLLLLTADLIGVDKGLSDSVCRDIEKQLGLKRDAIMIATSHTHTGPIVRKNLAPMYDLSPEESAKVDAYTRTLEIAFLAVAREALAALKPAKLAIGNGTAGFAVNRRNNRADQVADLRAKGELKGPFDHDVPVLRVTAPDGALRAIVFGYACHCTTLSSLDWSGDYAGFAQIELEKAHPEATALFFAGCGADQNPLPRSTNELAAKYGRELAAGAEKVLAGEMRPLSGGLTARYSILDLPFDTLPTREELEKRLADKNVYEQRRAKWLLQQGALNPTYPYPVQVWQMGTELTWVALGGEVVVDYSIRLKKEIPGAWVAGYCNDVMAYIPSLRVLKEGGYEGVGAMVYYGQPGPWAPEVEEKIIAKVHELARIPPTEPKDALRKFKLKPGLRIELVAAEPLVADPVDLAFDEEGRLFVVEMIDYPFRADPPLGRVRLLEDTDGDGRMDRSVVFADKLAWPTSLALWDGGVFVAAAPDILYLKDTDGDRIADRREVAFTGFGTKNVQALLNNLKWGPDHWIYGASGGNGGRVRSRLKPDAAEVSVDRLDFRFRPTGEFEAVSGGGQFGATFDDFGRRFVCNNSTQARHVVLEDRFLRRNPHLPVASVLHSIASDGDAGPVFRTSPAEPWRVVRTRMRLAGEVPGPVEHGGRVTGYFTSATGITVYRGSALGPEFYGNLFIGDVAGNLVHRKTLTKVGSTFRADRADEGTEFLASSDVWFRPVNFANGPDGALYICDMYRECIEHPDSIPEPIKRRLDLTSGRDRGRIWRITAQAPRPPEKPRLDSPNSWSRDTAARLQVKCDAGLLKSDLPAVRAAALGLLGPESATTLLHDPSPDVREQAVRLAPVEKLFDLNDADPRVRLQLACRMGETQDPRAVGTLRSLAVGADAWLRTAIAASSRGRELELLRGALPPECATLLSLAIGLRNDPAEVTAAWEIPAALRGLAEGQRRAGVSVSSRMEPLIEKAMAGALDETTAELLGYGQFDRVAPILAGLLDLRHPQSVRRAALRSLVTFKDAGVKAILLDAVERGRLGAADLSADLRKQLFGAAAADRRKVVATYRPALLKDGNASRGRAVYQKNCMACHKAGDEGQAVGPDLVTVRAWTPEQVMDQILDPNREVNPAYIGYKILTKDGRVLDGLVAAETSTSVTLRRAQGESDTVLRTSIEKMATSGVSIMPEGLESAIGIDEMADLLAFIRSNR